MPRSAARNAAAYPPGPAPTTARFMVPGMAFNHRGHSGSQGRDKAFSFSISHLPLCSSVSSVVHDFLSLHREQERLFKRFRDPSQKARRIGSINQAMIIGERERQNQSRLELTAALILNPLRLHARPRQTKDRYFRIIYDRRK